jgi:hypothetical protein
MDSLAIGNPHSSVVVTMSGAGLMIGPSPAGATDSWEMLEGVALDPSHGAIGTHSS